MRKTLTLLVLAARSLLVPAASAHVTVNPERSSRRTASPASRSASPPRRPNADTTKVVLAAPGGLAFVSFQPKPGWKRTVTMVKLDPPVDERSRARRSPSASQPSPGRAARSRPASSTSSG